METQDGWNGGAAMNDLMAVLLSLVLLAGLFMGTIGFWAIGLYTFMEWLLT